MDYSTCFIGSGSRVSVFFMSLTMELHWSRELDPRGNVPKVVDENLLITVSFPIVVSAKEPLQLLQLFPNPKIFFPPEFELHSFLANVWIRNYA